MQGVRSGSRQARRVVALGVGGLLAVGALAGCTGRPGVAAVVDGTSISTTELATTVRELGPYLQDGASSSVLSLLVQAPTVTAVASRNGIGVSDAQAKALLAQVVSQAGTKGAAVPSSAGSLAIARLVLVDQALSSASDATAVNQKITVALKELHVTVNPRFGSYDAANLSVVAPTTPAWISSTTAPTVSPTTQATTQPTPEPTGSATP